MRKPVLILLAVAFSAACRGGPPPSPSPAPVEVHREPDPVLSAGIVRGYEGAGDAVVATVGGAEIRRSDVGDFVIRYFRDQANEALTQLVDEAILEAEAAEIGLSVPRDALAEAVAREERDWARRLRAQTGPDETPEQWLRDRYGMTVAEHRAGLERLVRVQWLRDRVIRFRQLCERRVEVREAVFATEGEAARAAAAARGGADLGALASAGGVRAEVALPPFPRGEVSPPELEQVIWALPEGGVSDPVAVVEGERKLFHVYKMVRRIPARWPLAWAEAGPEVERALAERPVEAWEYRIWARRARERYALSVPR